MMPGGGFHKKASDYPTPFLQRLSTPAVDLLGLTANLSEVGSLVSISGVPLEGGLAHNAPEETPLQKYSAWAW